MPASNEVAAHWHHSVEGLSTSALDFFKSIEEALKAKEAPVKAERIELGESGILSAKRTYLRVSYERFQCDIGAFPFGKDYMFSWWLGRRMLNLGAMVGCLALFGLPVTLLILVAVAGLLTGTLLFTGALGAFMLYMQQGGSLGDVTIEDLMHAIPVVGPLYLRFFKPTTYYSEDTRIIFEETVNRVVTDVVSGILTINNMSPLTPEQAKPRGAKAAE